MKHRGMSIIEVMVFIAIMLVAVIGASGYRYLSSLDIRKSDNEITAGRIASYLCESWKGQGGGESLYNPTNDSNPSGIGEITAASSALAPEKPAIFTLLNNGGYYKIRVYSDNDNVVRTYYCTMSYRTINSASGNLETLNIIVSWPANENSTSTSALAKKSLVLSELLITH